MIQLRSLFAFSLTFFSAAFASSIHGGAGHPRLSLARCGGTSGGVCAFSGAPRPALRRHRVVSVCRESSTTSLGATREESRDNDGSQSGSKSKSKRGGGGGVRKSQTIGDVMKQMEASPGKFLAKGTVVQKKKARRSRSRVERPKQQYVYASQRKEMEFKGAPAAPPASVDGDPADAAADAEEVARRKRAEIDFLAQKERKSPQFAARSLGLVNPSATQRAEASVGDGLEEVPRILASLRVDERGDDAVTSNSFAYVVYKPPGWSIIGGEKKKNKKKGDGVEVTDDSRALTSVGEANSGGGSKSKSPNSMRRVKAYDETIDDFYYVEYDESDVLGALTPEERADLLREGGLNLSDDLAVSARGATSSAEYDDVEGEEDGDGDGDGNGKKRKEQNKKNAAVDGKISVPRTERPRANIESPHYPSLVSWLKNLKSDEGTPIKGGKNWAAVAGAADPDDSGLVLLCPRDRIGSVHVDRTEYVAIVGNGRKLAPRSKLQKAVRASAPGSCEPAEDSAAKVDVFSRLRRGREADPVLAATVTFPGGASTCSHAALLCQDAFSDGVRGDPAADPLDRRASRRLVHCASLAATSLARLEDEPVSVDAGPHLPDDVAIYADRRAGAMFEGGSYLGRRSGLRENGLTNAYREINGAADGHPGWIVDRYDRWLFAQQEENSPVLGPLPSLHDGYTAGVYYLATKVDRSVMGSTADAAKPVLLEGQPAPDVIPILENGITYHVNFESFSTGIFLDQRAQRAWLAECCTEETRVLNCFAHTGAFSVAAATAGASTVSLDLEQKWLGRIRPQMEANGIREWEGKHDCIYGDCFDWLARLRKRGEQYDIVILDPPSTSVGKKKKRWSVEKDMAELVALAAPLVKKDGLLWTTTNSASLRPNKFASACKKGLEDARISDAKLERVSPMPSDFPSIGTQPVKNLIWRIP